MRNMKMMYLMMSMIILFLKNQMMNNLLLSLLLTNLLVTPCPSNVERRLPLFSSIDLYLQPDGFILLPRFEWFRLSIGFLVFPFSFFSIRFPVSTSFCPPPVIHPSYMPCSFPFHATHIFIYICKSVTLVFSLMLVCRTLSRSFKFNIFRSIARCADLIFILKVFIRAHVSHP